MYVRIYFFNAKPLFIAARNVHAMSKTGEKNFKLLSVCTYQTENM